MVSEQLRDLAAEYVAAREAEAPRDEVRERLTARLDAEGIGYFDLDDIAHIAQGIVEGSFDILYHTCGQAVVLDGERFRIHGGELAGHLIKDCPRCGKPLDAYALYAEPGGETHNLLREAGLYPARDSLALIAEADQRSSTIEETCAMLKRLNNGDLLAVYGVIAALLEESEH